MIDEWREIVYHSSYVLRNGFGERVTIHFSEKLKNGWLIGILSPLQLIYKMSLKTQLLCGFGLFLFKKTVLDLVMHSILQVVAAFYAFCRFAAPHTI